MNIVLLGGPGAGKGTQSEFLKEKKSMFHISTGDLLREAVSNQTELGIQAKQFMDEGKLVPDNLILGLISEVYEKSDTSNGLIFDGFPRNVEQAKALDSLLEKYGNQIDKAILIDTPNEVVIERICSRRTCKNCGRIGSVAGLSEDEINIFSCPDCGGEMYQRDDDKIETIQNRLKVYEDQTSPLIDFYSNQNKLEKVNGALPNPSTVFSELEKLV